MLDQPAVVLPGTPAVSAPGTALANASGASPDRALPPTPSPYTLSDEQRRVVEHPITGGHLLVRAGPGSGKTETVRARIAALNTQFGVAPEAILALTFSRRAALDLTQRIRPADVWSGTFHAVSVDILEQWGGSIGIEPPLHIYAEERQADALLQAIARAGFAHYLDDRQQTKFTQELKNRISRRKRSGRDDPDRQTDTDQIPDDVVARVDEAYREVLTEAGALDFDDLITGAITVLRNDLDAASHYQRRLRFVFIDEFHDISPEQFELVRLLAPARSGVQVVAIADRDQAIYAWRGADVEAMLRAFRREYRPHEYQLTRNFRSTPEIIKAANAVIGGNRTSPPTTAASPSNTSTALPVDIVEFADEEAEAEELIRFIKRATGSGRYHYGDIAILYRTHGRSALAAELLPQHDLPITRVESGRFFRQQEVQEGLRYLELLLALRDDHFVPALNWPRVLVDEVTMVHLRRLARREATTLCDLAHRIDDFAAEVSPLTRAAVRDFFATVADPLGDLVEQPVTHMIEPFLDVLRRRRSPIPRAHRANLRDTLDHLGRRLANEAAALATAVTAGRPIAVRAARKDGDSAAAIVILAHTLRCYYGRDLFIAGPGDDLPANAFVIDLGQERAATHTGCVLTAWVTPQVTFNLGTQAWRLGQMLLMHHETAPDLPLVTFDLETGDRHPQTAEIIEIGAARLNGAAGGDRVFARLVRPSGPNAITRGASDLHGLTWEMVATQPAVADVLPDLLAFLDDDVLVGHNIEDFDYPILRRTVRDHCGPNVPLQHLLIDTYKMAKRVLPEQRSYRLEDLARLIDPGVTQEHRVEHDLGLTNRLFIHLCQEHRRQLELDILAEALPVVALSLLAADVPLTNDNALLAEIGARAAAFDQGATLQQAWEARVDPALASAGATWLATYRPESAAPEAIADDQAWATMEDHWRTALEVYSRHGGDPSLAGFLRYAALAESIDVVPLSDQPGADAAAAADDDPRRLGQAERITMMTVHAAKGLEWPLVFLLGVEADLFPGYWTRTEEDHDEERRLLYVGMTRARQRLCLLSSRSTNGRPRDLSPFLQAVPPNIITRR